MFGSKEINLSREEGSRIVTATELLTGSQRKADGSVIVVLTLSAI